MKKLILKGFTLCVLLVCGTVNADAQLSNILNKVVSAVTGGTTVTESNIAGTWTYSAPAVEFSSDNILSNLGGTAVSAKIEKKLTTYLKKVGVTTGKFSITFNSDKSFTATLANGKSSTGTYALSDGTLSLTFTTTGAKVNATTVYSGTDLELLMSADKLLSLMTAISNAASKANSSISAISTLLGQYSGMKVGLKFTK